MTRLILWAVSRKLRDFSVFALAPFVLMTVTTLSTPAAAATAGGHTLGGKWSAGSIKSHCDAAGGEFTRGPNGYGCTANGGSVHCNNKGKCQGSNPASLSGGKTGIGTVTVGGTKQPPQSGLKGKGGLSPVPVDGSKQTGGSNQPVTIQRITNTQQTGSGGGGGKK
jgi:hypothetical protein